MKHLTSYIKRKYNSRRKGCLSLDNQTPQPQKTILVILRFLKLALRSARLCPVTWQSDRNDPFYPPKKKLDRSYQSAGYVKNHSFLRLIPPFGRSFGLPKASSLYNTVTKKYRSFISKALLFSFCAVVPFVSNAGVCTGKLPNPITDVCWECLFPISIGSTKLKSGSNGDTENPVSPVCTCPTPFPRVGIAAGFWEPVRLVDVTKRPFCFVNLGGMEIDPGLSLGTGKAPGNGDKYTATWNVHWYVYPLLYWLNLLTDFGCLEQSSFDVAYVTELDPLWQDDELTFLLNPESVLFANPIAQAACVADCVASTASMPLDPLFWCAGCQGGMYPLNGKVQAHVNGIQSSLLATEKMAYKLHRQLLLPGTSGPEALCMPYPMPVIKKSQYRTQLINPIPTTGNGGCAPMGKSSVGYEMGKEIPVTGEDFGYLIWRKRNCCVL